MFSNKYFVLLALVTELVVLELALIFGGSYLDGWMNWPGYGVILGAFTGFSVWVIHLVFALKNLEAGEEQ